MRDCLPDARLICLGRVQAAILTFSADAATGALVLDGSFSTPSLLHSLAYNADSAQFYAVPAAERSTVLRLDAHGGAETLFGSESEAARLLAARGGDIDAIHSYADSLHLLCTACGSVLEVSAPATSRTCGPSPSAMMSASHYI